MRCKRCGSRIDRTNRCSDGSYKCPNCSRRFRPKAKGAVQARPRRYTLTPLARLLLIAAAVIAVVALVLAFTSRGASDKTAPAPTATEAPMAAIETASDPTPDPTATPEPTASPEPTSTPEPTAEPTETPDPNITSVHFRAVGDVMSHKTQLDLARQKDGTYNYDPQFQFVKDALTKADYTIANLEMSIAAKNYTGYPTFRIPESILGTLKDCGIDMFTMANNHSLDGFFDGLVYTIDKVEEYGFDHVGAYRTAEEAQQPTIVEINGIKFGFLAYTYGFNVNPGNVGAQNLKFCLKSLKNADFKADVQALRDAGAEVVICMPHWGEEGRKIVPDSCKKYAQAMVEAGVDIILGSHSHMVQPIDVGEMTVNGEKKDVLIAWSLGNFISNQTYPYEDCGIILDFTVSRDNRTGKISIHDVGYVPIYVCNTSSYIAAVCSGDYYDNKPGGMTTANYNRLRASVGELAEVIGSDGIAVLQN